MTTKEQAETIQRTCGQIISETEQTNLDADVEGRALELIKKYSPLVPHAVHLQLLEEVLFNLRGLGPVEALFKDPQVSEIMINGPGPVWVEKAGELQLTELCLSADNIQNLIERIVSPLGLRVDRTHPQVDGRLPDGSRVHIIAPPLAIDGPYITIRRFLKRNFQVVDFTPHKGVAALLKWAIRARANMVISGGTSSGKTTLLNALGRQIHRNHRLISIEDAAELSLGVEHIVRLEARTANAEGVGETTQRALLKSALRMRPDRILVGEVRGAEALDMLQAMNTGNEGSISTCHSNSARDTLSRLETMVLMANSGLTLQAIREQINSALDLVVHLQRTSEGVRQIVSVAEIFKDGEPVVLADSNGLHHLPRFQPRSDLSSGVDLLDVDLPSQSWLIPGGEPSGGEASGGEPTDYEWN